MSNVEITAKNIIVKMDIKSSDTFDIIKQQVIKVLSSDSAEMELWLDHNPWMLNILTEEIIRINPKRIITYSQDWLPWQMSKEVVELYLVSSEEFDNFKDFKSLHNKVGEWYEEIYDATPSQERPTGPNSDYHWRSQVVPALYRVCTQYQGYTL